MERKARFDELVQLRRSGAATTTIEGERETAFEKKAGELAAASQAEEIKNVRLAASDADDKLLQLGILRTTAPAVTSGAFGDRPAGPSSRTSGRS